MLPADIIAEITTAIAGLQLEASTTAQILSAVLVPLLRSGPTDPARERPPKHRRKRDGRRRARRGPRGPYKRHAPTEARDRARAALKASPPGAAVSAVAKAAGVSRATVVNAAKDLARETRKEARRQSRTEAPRGKTDPQTERGERAQRFLKEALAHGPKEVQAIEAAAAKAHINDVVLAQARAALGVIATRADSGMHAVQWSLPG